MTGAVRNSQLRSGTPSRAPRSCGAVRNSQSRSASCPRSGLLQPLNHPNPGSIRPAGGSNHPQPGSIRPAGGSNHFIPGSIQHAGGSNHPQPGSIRPAGGSNHCAPGSIRLAAGSTLRSDGELRLDHQPVAAALGEQLFVGALLDHAALVQHQDAVGLGHGRQAVWNSQSRRGPMQVPSKRRRSVRNSQSVRNPSRGPELPVAPRPSARRGPQRPLGLRLRGPSGDTSVKRHQN